MDQQNMSPENNLSIEDNGKGATIGVVIIVVLLILGGFYVFSQKQNSTDEQAQELNTQGSSTEINDIEADLEASNLEGLDRELEDIEAELNSGLY